MRKFLRKSPEALCALLLCMLLFAGSAGADVVDRVVAKVNDEIVTLSLVRERAEILLGRMQAARATSVPSDKELLKEALDQIIDERLQLQDGRKNNIGVDDQSVQRAFDDIKKRNNVSQEEMVRMLESEGRTLDQYLETIREQILLSKVVRFQMGDPGNVSEKAVHAYYQNHLADYWVPPRPHVSHILFIMDELMDEGEKEVKRQVALEVLAKIKNGEDFEDLAKEYSEDVSGPSGGSIGSVTLGNLVPEFEKVAFSLKEGEISELVETKYGLHIIRVDKLEVGRTRPLEEVKPQIEETLGREARVSAYKKWMDELKSKSFIQTFLFEGSEGEESGSERTAQAGSPAASAGLKAGDPAEELDSVEKQLSRIKKLYASKRISETEYQKRKQALLDRL